MKIDFTVDLIWWGSLRLAPIMIFMMLNPTVKYKATYSHERRSRRAATS